MENWFELMDRGSWRVWRLGIYLRKKVIMLKLEGDLEILGFIRLMEKEGINGNGAG